LGPFAFIIIVVTSIAIPSFADRPYLIASSNHRLTSVTDR